MEFKLSALLLTIVCFLITMIVASKSHNDGDKEWFQNLNHPDNGWMVKFLNKYGIVVYLFFGIVLYYLFARNDIVPIIVMITILIIYGLSPLFLYKTKNLKLFFATSFIAFIPLTLLVFFLLQTNLILAIITIIYCLFLIYEMSYWYRLMKLNN